MSLFLTRDSESDNLLFPQASTVKVGPLAVLAWAAASLAPSVGSKLLLSAAVSASFSASSFDSSGAVVGAACTGVVSAASWSELVVLVGTSFTICTESVAGAVVGLTSPFWVGNAPPTAWYRNW